ncbi:cytidylate kinase family protein [Candidatus Parcubacteria bacterium]|nr:cytidylate kinase family protein [Patescibacteria group bacterium]MCG2694185.1 cytidylate kinase family protein [Candidatus Parcubacteria bacterium]
MYPIVTISGRAGSGKSTVGRSLAKKLKAKRIYVGGIRRDLAKKKGMTLSQLNNYALTHPETDIDIDKAAQKEARKTAKKMPVVVEGRTQYYFFPKSIKLYFDVDFYEAAKRIWKDLQDKTKSAKRNEGELKSFDEVLESIKKREKNDVRRYRKYYGINYKSKKNFDLVIDTTKISAEKVLEKVLVFVRSKIK